jgi:hypothetical protein
MKTKIYASLIAISLSLNILAQGGLLNQNAAISLQGNVLLWIDGASGHYTSTGNGIFNITAASPIIDVYGNWTNNASNVGFANDLSTVRLLGGNQTIGGTSSTTFYNLVLGGTAGSVKTLNRSISVGGISNLTGVLNLGNASPAIELNLNQYTLTITNPNMTIAGTTGYINSENGCGTCNVWSSAVTWNNVPNAAVTIPFGVSGTRIPFTMTKSSGSGDITVSTRSTVANNTQLPSAVTAMNVPAISVTQTNDGTNTVIDRWWYITPSSNVTLDLNFYYRGVENTCSGCPQSGNFGAQYWVNYSATNQGWLPCSGPSWNCSTLGSWPGVTAGTQNATASTGAVSLPQGNLQTSYWVLACQAKPLPIELTSFTANCQKNNTVLLQWKTASEVNADKFEIQKSTNGIDFSVIATVPAIYPYGGSYSFTDDTHNFGIVYYRLRMIDKDGTSKLSPVADVDIQQCASIRSQIYGYGNNVMININTTNDQHLSVLVYDALGRILVNKPIEIKEGANSFQIPLNVSQSIYFVKLIDDNGKLIQVQKVLLSE